MTPGAGLLVATSGVNVSAGDVALLVVVLVLLAASALLALAETSLVRMSRAKAMALVDDGRRGAKVLVRLTENPQGFLNPLLLLVLICQLVVATLVGVPGRQLVRGVGRAGRHRVRDRGHLRAR
jgi:CBS domain containing-hemolysin-like protein